MKKKIAVILHSETSDMGYIGEILKKNQCNIEINRPLNNGSFSNSFQELNFDALIIFGGNNSANNLELIPEINFIKKVLKKQIPILGICLGGQLLAKALGGKIEKHSANKVEIGFYPLKFSEAARINVFSEAPTHFMQWHKEGFSLPKGAIHLASSETFACQAFQFNNSYAFQFHPEVNLNHIYDWNKKPYEKIYPNAQSLEMQLIIANEYLPNIHQWLENFLMNYFLK